MSCSREKIMRLGYRNSQKILPSAAKIRNAVTLWSANEESLPTLNREPTCPPKNTAKRRRKNPGVSTKGASLVHCPKNPNKELTKIKKLALAAICLGLPHPIKYKR